MENDRNPQNCIDEQDARQAAVIAFLCDPATHAGREVQRIDTHGALVFLAGDRAYKIKRAVTLPFFDFSTLDLRHRACVEEVRLNRRAAPDLYLGLGAVVRHDDGRLSLEPSAPDDSAGIVEWVVVMARFPDDALLDRIARTGGLTDDIMRTLADAVAALHRDEPPRHDHGGAADMADIAAVVSQRLHRYPDQFDPAAAARFDDAIAAAFRAVGPLLDRRKEDGFVRHCHGDLHLRNIVLLGGRPVPFDRLEFDERYAVTDVLYDLAFLLMDLEHRGLRAPANILFNRYLSTTGDLDGLAALPLFLGLRAAIRAHIGATAAEGQGAADAAATRAEAARYFDLALSCAAPPPPRLVAVGGLSGTGKSTLARALAPHLGPVPGALVLRSDVVRKRLLGVDETTPLPTDAYAEPVTDRVYAAMLEDAARTLAAGHAVVCDAVFARPDQRAAVEAAARRAGVAFTGFWLEADEGTQVARVTARQGDASDATAAVVRRQAAFDLGPIAWTRLSTLGDRSAVAAAALRHLHSA